MSGTATRLVRNLMSMTAMRLVTAALSFGLMLLLARQWGATRLGEFSTVFAFFLLIQQLPLLGLHLPVARHVAANPAEASEQAVNALGVAVPVAFILCIGIGFLGAAFYAVPLHAAFWFVGSACLPTAVTVVGEAVLAGQERMVAVARIGAVENIARTVVALLLVYFDSSLAMIMAAFVTARACAAWAYWHAGLGSLIDPMRLRGAAMLRLVRMIPVFFGILLFSVGFGRLDTILLSNMTSMENVGRYAPASKVYELAVMIPSMLAYVVFPVFSRYHRQSRENFRGLYLHILRALLIVGIPAVLALAYLAVPVLSTVLGPQYELSGRVLQLLAFAVLLVALDQLLTVVLLSGDREDLDLRVIAGAFLVYVTLLLALIPRFGVEGAGLATLATAAIRLLIRWWYAATTVGVPSVFADVAKTAAAGVAMALVLYGLPATHPLVAITASLVAYGISAGICGAITRGDLRSIRQALSAGAS